MHNDRDQAARREENPMSDTDHECSAGSQCYAVHRLAGELLGRIAITLGFGELSMHIDGRCFVYQWGFTAKGKRYGSQVTVDALELLTSKYVEHIADRISGRWKSEHRKVTEYNDGNQQVAARDFDF